MSAEKLSKCGITPHSNIQPYIANKKFNRKSLVPATLQLIDELNIKLPEPTSFLQKEIYNKVSPIYNQSDISMGSPSSTPVLSDDVSCVSSSFSLLASRSIPINDAPSAATFDQCEIVKLCKLNRGYYNILSISDTRSINEYPRLLINNGGKLCTVYCNQSLREQVNAYNSSFNKVGTLIVYCHKRKSNGDRTTDAKINFI